MAVPVITSSPVTIRTRMRAAWALATASPGLVPWRIDHGDQAGDLQVGDVAEQVAVGVESGRVEVPDGGGHHPAAIF